MKKPNKCCDVGSYEHTVPMPIRGRVQDVDLCIATIVAALNAANITTVASCCGHGKILPTVILEDERCIVIYPTIKAMNAAVAASLTEICETSSTMTPSALMKRSKAERDRILAEAAAIAEEEYRSTRMQE